MAPGRTPVQNDGVNSHQLILAGFLPVTAFCALLLLLLVKKLRRAREELDSHRNRLDALLRRMPALVWTVDKNLRFTSARGAPLKDIGVTAEQVVGLLMTDFFGTSDPDFPSLKAHREALAGFPVEYRQNWSERVFHVHLEPLKDGADQITGVIGVSQDITRDLEDEEGRQRANKMEALARLAGRVAHDFNNALTTVLGYCDLLLADLPGEDPRANDIRAIQTAGLRAAATAERLTSFSPHHLNEARPLDLNALLQGLDRELGEVLGPGVARVYRLAPALPLVKLDPAQMKKIVRHIAVNAREAMAQGGQFILATTRYNEHGAEKVRLILQDTGTGLSEEARAHLFEPYFSTRSRDKARGLGLATCYGMVKQNDGTITVRSAEGRGTAFHLDFAAWTGLGVEGEDLELLEGAPPRGTETILLVEDEEPIRLVLTRVLGSLGYTVIVAENGENALRRMEEQGDRPVHLLLSDVAMPGMGGVALAREMSARRPGMKRILMSGYAEKSLLTDGTLPSGTDFLQKPFTNAVLAEKIRETLDVLPDLIK
jgi:two-component system, cell cycle sensor histidine kinase and response regulator CckA